MILHFHFQKHKIEKMKNTKGRSWSITICYGGLARGTRIALGGVVQWLSTVASSRCQLDPASAWNQRDAVAQPD
jgi:hypothetical protein